MGIMGIKQNTRVLITFASFQIPYAQCHSLKLEFFFESPWNTYSY